jgi:hypothetical protein
MLALMGHMSRAMLERYSRIRMVAKRHAISGITLGQKGENSEVVPVKVPVSIDSGGERGRNRTYNLVIKSHLLCQLSYAP